MCYLKLNENRNMKFTFRAFLAVESRFAVIYLLTSTGLHYSAICNFAFCNQVLAMLWVVRLVTVNCEQSSLSNCQSQLTSDKRSTRTFEETHTSKWFKDIYFLVPLSFWISPWYLELSRPKRAWMSRETSKVRAENRKICTRWGGHLFWRFCKMFSLSSQAVGLYCSCYAAQASKGNFQKTCTQW